MLLKFSKKNDTRGGRELPLQSEQENKIKCPKFAKKSIFANLLFLQILKVEHKSFQLCIICHFWT